VFNKSHVSRYKGTFASFHETDGFAYGPGEALKHGSEKFQARAA